MDRKVSRTLRASGTLSSTLFDVPVLSQVSGDGLLAQSFDPNVSKIDAHGATAVDLKSHEP